MRWRLMRGLESSTPSLSEWRRQLPRYAPAYPGAVTQDSLGFVGDLPLEGVGFELVWGFSCQVVFSVYCQFFVRRGKAVLRPVACDQVRGARGRGQGTETLAELSGLPLSGACVSQRLDA